MGIGPFTILRILRLLGILGIMGIYWVCDGSYPLVLRDMPLHYSKFYSKTTTHIHHQPPRTTKLLTSQTHLPPSTSWLSGESGSFSPCLLNLVSLVITIFEKKFNFWDHLHVRHLWGAVCGVLGPLYPAPTVRLFGESSSTTPRCFPGFPIFPMSLSELDRLQRKPPTFTSIMYAIRSAI